MSITLKEIIDVVKPLQVIGDKNQKIERLVELKSYTGDPEELTWSNDKNLFKLKDFDSGTFICSLNIIEAGYNDGCNYLIVDHPRRAFQHILTKFYYKPDTRTGIESSAFIHPTARLGENVYVGHNAVIDEGCVVGNNVRILNNTVIMHHTIIGNHVSIGNNNTIGNNGFGYEKDEHGWWKQIPHVGNVIIHDHVEIGNNNCIDRGVLGSTILEENVKIDNLVHVAHNVLIGSNTLVIACSQVAGSVVVGKNSWISPSCSIMNGITLGENTMVSFGAVVTQSFPDNARLMGNPARNFQREN
jgi:UDP-3-O-[3-hydroxymyristoyl] glucosamine N-acyltransferase